MNTYLIPVFDYDTDDVYIATINARNYSNAQEKCIAHVCQKYGIPEPEDWEDFIINVLPETDIVIGELKEINEFG